MSGPRLRAGWLAGLAFAVSGGAADQGPAQPEIRARWETGPARAGWCLEFLLRPEAAQKDMAQGYRPARIEETEGWHPELRRAAESDTTGLGWFPSRVCQVYFQFLQADGRRFDRGAKGSPVAVAFWEVAARRADGEPGATGSVRALGTNNDGLKHQMETQFVPLEPLQLTTQPLRDSSDHRYQVKIGKTIVIFDGYPVPDSTLQPMQVNFQLAMDGDRRMRWTVDLRFQPDRLEAFPGGLRIQGKGDLAKALSSSPVRIVGPVFSGGGGLVTFSR